MLPSPALRAQLARDFHRLAYNAKEPREVVDVVFALQDAVQGCLRELMRAWSPASGSRRLLEDALARAIAFLPFRDRISASQVSRGWRATALAVPALWSDIEVCAAMVSPVDVLAMALARTGRHPLNLCVRGHPLHNLPTQALLETLEPHRHRLMSLTWTGSPSPPASFFARPAPSLESLKYDGTWTSSGGTFLGGRAGRLHTLHLARFRPPSSGSAALSSVTDLSFGILAAASDPSPDYGLSALFALFPRLRALEISRVAAEHVPILRALRPPPSLAALSLRSDDRSGGCNLLSLCEAWDCERMKDVRLRMPMASYQTQDHSTLLAHCLRLTLELFSGDRGLRIVSTDCCGKTRSVTLVADDDSERVFSLCHSIFGARERLAHLCSLTVSMDILEHILRENLALPHLKEIILLFEEKSTISSFSISYHWPWALFEIGSVLGRKRGDAPVVRDVGRRDAAAEGQIAEAHGEDLRGQLAYRIPPVPFQYETAQAVVECVLKRPGDFGDLLRTAQGAMSVSQRLGWSYLLCQAAC